MRAIFPVVIITQFDIKFTCFRAASVAHTITAIAKIVLKNMLNWNSVVIRILQFTAGSQREFKIKINVVRGVQCFCCSDVYVKNDKTRLQRPRVVCALSRLGTGFYSFLTSATEHAGKVFLRHKLRTEK